MSVRAVAVSVFLAGAVAIAGCGGSGSKSKSSSGSSSASAGPIPAFNAAEKVTITYWVPFTGSELGQVRKVIAGFERAYPSVKVRVVGNINDEKIIAAVHSGNVPDAALSFTTANTGVFCRDGAFLDLGPAIARDGVDLNNFPDAQRKYTEYKGTRCVLPAMADTYGLYYNKPLLEKAGISGPPKTVTELAEDAKKLTVRSGGGFKRVGYTPFFGFYESTAAHYSPLWGAAWQNSEGKSAIASDSGWKEMAEWVKGLVDWYGSSALVRFQAGAGGEFTGSNAFMSEKLAMEIDGEWRTALIKSEAPKLQYMTAPMPVADNKSELYGGGFTTGNITGIPKGSPHPAAAWQLVKYLATNVQAQTELTNDLGNVPTWIPALEAAKKTASPQFATFLQIFASPHTTTIPITAQGETIETTLEKYLEKFQAGNGGNLTHGLESVASQIDAAESQANAGNVP
jgi:multiple sugar transport system substrate-binding protein